MSRMCLCCVRQQTHNLIEIEVECSVNFNILL